MDQTAAGNNITTEASCSVVMYSGRCQRPIYHTIPGIDPEPVCLLHSHDPNKDADGFLKEIEETLERAAKRTADFSKVVFSRMPEFMNNFISAHCVFQEATFLCDAVFISAVFQEGASFDNCNFAKKATFGLTTFEWRVTFSGAKFAEDANFFRAQFKREAYFSGAVFDREKSKATFASADFKGDARFDKCQFGGATDFHEAKFGNSVTFNDASFPKQATFYLAQFEHDANFFKTSWENTSFAAARFVGVADFRLAAFAGDTSFVEVEFANDVEFSQATIEKRPALFRRAKFKGNAFFTLATFSQTPEFHLATFTQGVVFTLAIFPNGANFVETTFSGEANFAAATLTGCIDFYSSHFLGAAHFYHTIFRQSGLQPGPVFTQSYFDKPDSVVFQDTNLDHALFYNCDVSKVRFAEVKWPERKNGKQKAFEEDVSLEHDRTYALKDSRGFQPRNYRAIAELYHQLKKNYDDRQDPWTGGDFHYGEMEMKRMAVQRRGPIARSLRQYFGLIALYKYASEYGESYLRPVIGLASVLLIFTVLFPLAGLEENETRSAATTVARSPIPAKVESRIDYAELSRFIDRAQPRGKVYAVARFFGNSLMTALSVAGFQKDLKYEPSYPWGRALALLELLLTSTLVALFFLAIRRQFQR